MTCLAGAVGSGGETWIGADSQWTYGESLQQPYGKKIMGIPGHGFLVAYCGSVRGGQLLNRILQNIKPTPPPWNLNMAIDLAEYVKRQMQKNGLKKEGKDPGDMPKGPSQMLIATPGRLFGVHGDYAVSEDPKFMANGSGRDFALGAFYAMEKKPLTARLKVQMAIEAACRFDPSVSKPIVIQQVAYKRKP